VTKINTTLPNPEDPVATAERVGDALRALDKGISFGTPQDPADDTSTDLAGSTAAEHPGTLENITGSWVEVEIDNNTLPTLDEVITCHHNLNVPVAVAGEPNVRWIVMGIQHDGAQEDWWNEEFVRPNSMREGVNGPDWAIPWLDDGKVSPGVGLYWFDATDADEYMYFNVAMPHDWSQGTTIYPQVHWVPGAGAPQAGEICQWELEYTWADIAQTYGATTLLTGLVHYPDDDPLIVNRHYVTLFDDPTDGIDGSGYTISSVLVCRLGRLAYPGNGYTNLDEDAGLLGVSFHYHVDGYGSPFGNVLPNSDSLHTKAASSATQAGTATCRFQTGDDVSANSIELRIHANPIIDIAVAHPLKLTLFFIPAVR